MNKNIYRQIAGEQSEDVDIYTTWLIERNLNSYLQKNLKINYVF